MKRVLPKLLLGFLSREITFPLIFQSLPFRPSPERPVLALQECMEMVLCRLTHRNGEGV